VNAARRVDQPPSPGVRGAAIHATSVSTIGKSAITRFPNSIVEWPAPAGKNAPSWQPGHDSQASPEPVSRTRAPVRTIRYSETAEAAAICA
jgi:hypothetical protein